MLTPKAEVLGGSQLRKCGVRQDTPIWVSWTVQTDPIQLGWHAPQRLSHPDLLQHLLTAGQTVYTCAVFWAGEMVCSAVFVVLFFFYTPSALMWDPEEAHKTLQLSLISIHSRIWNIMLQAVDPQASSCSEKQNKKSDFWILNIVGFSQVKVVM